MDLGHAAGPVAGMKIVVDFDLCESNGFCMQEAPAVFRLTDDDVLEILVEQPPESLRADCERAATRCPRGAITVID